MVGLGLSFKYSSLDLDRNMTVRSSLAQILVPANKRKLYLHAYTPEFGKSCCRSKINMKQNFFLWQRNLQTYLFVGKKF